MGFLSKLFGKKEEQVNEVVLSSYMKGKVVDITEVPDPVFAQKMMGDGFKSGDVEILIHVGLETVAMKGEGFDVAVSAGDRVEVGQTLLTYDLELVKEKAKDIITPCVITNMEAVENIEVLKLNETVDFSQEVAKVKLK